MSFTPADTVGQIVRDSPATVSVFESLGIDFCCGGHRSLTEACAKASMPLDQVLSDLEAAAKLAPVEEDCHWLTCSLTELVSHIVSRHHGYARREMPVLISLAGRVANRHGVVKPQLLELKDVVEALDSELATHMMKEEAVLFPALESLDESPSGARAAVLMHPIRRMMEEHDDAGELLRCIRALTDNYALPANACASFQALYRGLSAFEQDLHRHIHLENNILFPRALECEKHQSEAVA